MVIWHKSILISLAISTLASWPLHASGGCEASFMQQYQDSLRIADSLRPDKSGQMRVYTISGSEFTAGQAQWMQGQLRLVAAACARGDQMAAIRLLNDVQQLLKAHQRRS